MIDLRCGFRYFLYILMQLYMVVSFELQAGVFATRSALFLSDHRRRVSYIYIYIYTYTDAVEILGEGDLRPLQACVF
jgi:hypothetical protein